jgi:hypothetical protein
VSPRKVVLRALVAALLLLGLSFVIGANAGWQRMEGITEACARIYEEHKTEIRGYHWDWLPPAWVCEFDDRTGIPRERRLPFGQR